MDGIAAHGCVVAFDVFDAEFADEDGTLQVTTPTRSPKGNRWGKPVVVAIASHDAK